MKVKELKEYINQVDDDFEFCVNVYRRGNDGWGYPTEIVETTPLEFVDISYSEKRLVLGLELEKDRYI